MTTGEMLRREGEAEGKAKGKRDLLLRLLRHRFRRVPAAARARIDDADVADLDKWALRVLEAKRLDDVLRVRARTRTN